MYLAVLQSGARLILAGVLATILSATAAADDYDKASQAYEAGRFATVIRLLEPLARTGDPRAQHLLGRTHEWANSRDGVRRDVTRALFWYERAAKQDYLPAKRSLGRVLAGDGIDAKRGYQLLLDLAKQGDARSQGLLGTFLLRRSNPAYTKKYHLPGTHEDGLKWLHQAAGRKDTLAAQVLMRWYRNQGLFAEGYFWDLVVAGIFGEAGPRILPPISERLTKRQRADVERRAAAWLKARGVKPVHRVDPK